MAEGLKQELIIWRLVLQKICSLQELETIWSLDDVLRANALLDMQSDLTEVESKKAKK